MMWSEEKDLYDVSTGFDSDTIYTDIPLQNIRTAKTQEATPQRIREMRSIAFTSEARWKTSAWLFYTQGSFLADYEDDYPPDKDFVRYYPTYRDLTVPQLRGYFSWRTMLRNGNTPDLVLPYLLMYTYELINCIGTSSPEEACYKLMELGNQYASAGQPYLNSLSSWITDFVVCYGLSPDIIANSQDIRFDKALMILTECDSFSDYELFDAIRSLSAYSIDDSLFAAQYHDEIKAAATAAFRDLSAFFKEHRVNTVCDKYFGKPVNKQHNMFSSAIYYNREPIRNCTVELNPIHRYTCTNGTWYCEKYYGNRQRNKQLGIFLRTVDSIMRERYDFRYKLTLTDATKVEVAAINSALDRIEEEKRRQKAANIEIDLSCLDAIRTSADITRDRLLVEEDEEENAPVTETISVEEEKEGLLTSDETAFLKAVLRGEGYEEAAMSSGSLPSVLAERINEKLFDEFDDIVIDFSGDVPVVIEDYTDDIEEMINREERK